MDNFINLAKQGYSAYQASQENHPSNPDVSKAGGQEYNSPNNSYNSNNSGPQFDQDEVALRAEQHGSGDASLYRNAMGHVNNNQHEHNEEIDQGEVQDAHDKAYNQGGASGLSAKAMGGAAALQALKKFTGGGSGGGGGGGGGGSSTSELISLAMAEASKLFDSSGGSSSGNKQDVVNGAAMTVMKLLVQSKVSGAMGGNSGGMGNLMGLASKFM